ncbi:hypothetical protein Tco_1456037 [Tanacetum coccineum]
MLCNSNDDDNVGAEADMNNLNIFIPVSPIPTTRIHKNHRVEQIIRDLNSAPQTRRMIKNLKEHEEPRKVIHALTDPYWIEAMQDELLQFKLQKTYNIFIVCPCARYQLTQKCTLLYEKRLVRYLKGQPKLGLWYPKDSPFDLVAYTDSDYARASLDKKSTTRGSLILSDRKKIIITEASVRRDLQLEDAEGVDCLPNVTIFEQLTLMSAKTTAWNEFSSIMASVVICLATNQKFNCSKYIFESMVKNLDSVAKFLMYPRFVQVFLDNQLEGMINHNRIYIAPSHTKKVFANMKRKQRPRKPKRKDTEIPQSMFNVEVMHMRQTIEDSGGGPKRQDTMGDTIAQTRFENVSKFSNNLLLAGFNTPRSGEDSLQPKELMEFCTKLQQRVLDLENTKTAQAHAAKDLSDVDMTLAQALAELKSTKPRAITTVATTTTTDVTRPKAKGLFIQEQEQVSTPITSLKDKGKGIMVEEHLKMKKK